MKRKTQNGRNKDTSENKEEAPLSHKELECLCKYFTVHSYNVLVSLLSRRLGLTEEEVRATYDKTDICAQLLPETKRAVASLDVINPILDKEHECARIIYKDLTIDNRSITRFGFREIQDVREACQKTWTDMFISDDKQLPSQEMVDTFLRRFGRLVDGANTRITPSADTVAHLLVQHGAAGLSLLQYLVSAHGLRLKLANNASPSRFPLDIFLEAEPPKDTTLFEYLVQQKAAYSAPSLLISMQRGDHASTLTLLQSHIPTQGRNSGLLMCAVQQNWVDVVKLISGAAPTNYDAATSELIYAAQHNQVEMLNVFMPRGTTIKHPYFVHGAYTRDTPFVHEILWTTIPFSALRSGRTEVVDFVQSRFPSAYADSFLTLYHLIKYNQPQFLPLVKSEWHPIPLALEKQDDNIRIPFEWFQKSRVINFQEGKAIWSPWIDFEPFKTLLVPNERALANFAYTEPTDLISAALYFNRAFVTEWLTFSTQELKTQPIILDTLRSRWIQVALAFSRTDLLDQIFNILHISNPLKAPRQTNIFESMWPFICWSGDVPKIEESMDVLRLDRQPEHTHSRYFAPLVKHTTKDSFKAVLLLSPYQAKLIEPLINAVTEQSPFTWDLHDKLTTLLSLATPITLGKMLPMLYNICGRMNNMPAIDMLRMMLDFVVRRGGFDIRRQLLTTKRNGQHAVFLAIRSFTAQRTDSDTISSTRSAWNILCSVLQSGVSIPDNDPARLLLDRDLVEYKIVQEATKRYPITTASNNMSFLLNHWEQVPLATITANQPIQRVVGDMNAFLYARIRTHILQDIARYLWVPFLCHSTLRRGVQNMYTHQAFVSDIWTNRMCVYPFILPVRYERIVDAASSSDMWALVRSYHKHLTVIEQRRDYTRLIIVTDRYLRDLLPEDFTLFDQQCNTDALINVLGHYNTHFRKYVKALHVATAMASFGTGLGHASIAKDVGFTIGQYLDTGGVASNQEGE